MQQIKSFRHMCVMTFGMMAVLFTGSIGFAQAPVDTPKPPPTPTTPAGTASTPTTPVTPGVLEATSQIKQEELDQLLAPIALYPDSLLSQILMASTYPLEIVQADRFVKANKDLKDQSLTKELEARAWDASVKSLINFPDLLAAMSEQLELTTKIGDAFLADQKRVLETVQKLRDKAHEQGNLKSDEQQKIVVENENAPTQVIVIESTKPEVVYVPAYNRLSSTARGGIRRIRLIPTTARRITAQPARWFRGARALSAVLRGAMRGATATGAAAISTSTLTETPTSTATLIGPNTKPRCRSATQT